MFCILWIKGSLEKKKDGEMKEIVFWFFCGCSTFLFRLGGASKSDFPWLPPWMVNTKARDIGCSLVAILTMLLMGIKAPFWIWFITLGTQFAFLCAYHKWFQRLFGFPDDDVYYPAWLMTGFGYSISALPVVIYAGLWWGFILRTIVLTLGICAIREFFSDVNIEECGSGFLYCVSLRSLTF